LLMTEEALQGTLPCPAPIAIHDDGDVLGDAQRVKLLVKCELLGRKFVQAGAGFEDRPDGRRAQYNLADIDASIARCPVQRSGSCGVWAQRPQIAGSIWGLNFCTSVVQKTDGGKGKRLDLYVAFMLRASSAAVRIRRDGFRGAPYHIATQRRQTIWNSSVRLLQD
jgi:hypothetical protein